MRDIPRIPNGLIEILERNFPDRVPSINASEREIWSSHGAVQVIRFIKSIKEEQDGNILL